MQNVYYIFYRILFGLYLRVVGFREVGLIFFLPYIVCLFVCERRRNNDFKVNEKQENYF